VVRDEKGRKPLKWLGDSLVELRTWPKSATEDAGGELCAVQEEREPSDWKPMTSIGLGVNEIRVRGEESQYRVIYVAKFEEAVYVLHTFEKRTQKTPKHDLEIASKRYRELLSKRKELGL
jgi:phage-related protein